jgi:hypothetical protein
LNLMATTPTVDSVEEAHSPLPGMTWLVLDAPVGR